MNAIETAEPLPVMLALYNAFHGPGYAIALFNALTPEEKANIKLLEASACNGAREANNGSLRSPSSSVLHLYLWYLAKGDHARANFLKCVFEDNVGERVYVLVCPGGRPKFFVWPGAETSLS